MAEARLETEWARASALLALIANVNRDPRKARAFRPDDFNPFAEARTTGVKLDKGNIHVLKRVFVDGEEP